MSNEIPTGSSRLMIDHFTTVCIYDCLRMGALQPANHLQPPSMVTLHLGSHATIFQALGNIYEVLPSVLQSHDCHLQSSLPVSPETERRDFLSFPYKEGKIYCVQLECTSKLVKPLTNVNLLSLTE